MGIHARAHEHEVMVMAVWKRMLMVWMYEVVPVVVVVETSIHLSNREHTGIGSRYRTWLIVRSRN
jgi:hypothetical protein